MGACTSGEQQAGCGHDDQPGERALVLEYGVALGTIRRAVEELTGRGLVVVLPAKGTFVRGD